MKEEEAFDHNFDFDYIESLSFLESESFSNFLLFQKELMTDLYGLNYEPTFDAKLIQIPKESFSIFEVVKKAYPSSKPDNRYLVESSWNDMKDQVSELLSIEGDTGSHPNESIIPKLSELVDTYWSHVDSLVSIENTQIFSYQLEDGLPGAHAFWSFAYFIYDHAQNHCLAIVGNCSD